MTERHDNHEARPDPESVTHAHGSVIPPGAGGEFIKPRPAPPADAFDVPFGCNEIRLTGRQWLAAGAICLALVVALPLFWRTGATFEPGPAYRVPYALNNDYWFIERFYGWAADNNAALAVGDSVLWGRYVAADATLPHALGPEFANLGINGIHPAAIHGLLKHYGGAIRDRDVLINFNPLWMSSPEADLSTDGETRINHPKLLPQFAGAPRAYDESLSERIGIVVKRKLPIFPWVDHLRVLYFDNSDVPHWTGEHPYALPEQVAVTDLPEGESAGTLARSWRERRTMQVAFRWVGLEESYQWAFFRRTVEMLRERGNRVFVLVGPFNEHMIRGEASQAAYAELKAGMARWLDAEDVDYLMPDVLPSEIYADASHPLAEGYRMLAGQLQADPDYRAIFAR